MGMQLAAAWCKPPCLLCALPSGAADRHRCAAAPPAPVPQQRMHLCWLILPQPSPAQLGPGGCGHGPTGSPSPTEQPSECGTPEAPPGDQRPAAAGSASCGWSVPADLPAPGVGPEIESGQVTEHPGPTTCCQWWQ